MSSISQTPSIYRFRHIASGKVYVGSAINPRTRYRAHIGSLKRGTHRSRYLQRAWDKHGADAFVFEILEPVLFVEDLITREQYWIDTLHAADPAHGYNVAPIAGSTLGVKATDETRARQSERAKKRTADPEYRAWRSELTKAQFTDPEMRARQSERAKAQMSDPAARARKSEQTKAQFASPEARARRSEQSKAQFADPAMRARVSAQNTARFADPAVRAAHAARQKEVLSHPDVRAKNSAAIKLKWQDPVYRANVLAARAAARERNRKP